MRRFGDRRSVYDPGPSGEKNEWFYDFPHGIQASVLMNLRKALGRWFGSFIVAVAGVVERI